MTLLRTVPWPAAVLVDVLADVFVSWVCGDRECVCRPDTDPVEVHYTVDGRKFADALTGSVDDERRWRNGGAR